MSKLLSSASKLVLLGFALAIIIGLFTGNITEDTFKVASLMVLTYYFTSKGDSKAPFGDK